jgi:hypothetical protein
MKPKMGIVITIALGLAIYLISIADKAFKYDSDLIKKQIINEENERIHKYDEFTGNISYLVELENEYSQLRENILISSKHTRHYSMAYPEYVFL